MSEIQSWLVQPPEWTEEHLKLIKNVNCIQQSVSLDDILKKSDDFGIRFPIETVRNKTLLSSVPKQILERNVQGAYPVIHEKVLHFCAEFLLFKLEYGSDIEKELYLNMNLLQFIQRLLIKRAFIFIDNQDFVLRNGKFFAESEWESIGTKNQKYPLVLEDYLSCDELKLSAFLSVSSYSYFINSGSRRNDGTLEDYRKNIQEEGIIIGLAGTKLTKPDVMEFQEIVITRKQNIVLNGYGACSSSIHNLFSKFYETSPHLFSSVRYGPIDDISRFKRLQNGYIFDNEVYAKRVSIMFDTLLLEANHRAQKCGKFAYVHLIGIGLGNCKISDHQEDVFVDTLGLRISALSKNLNSTSDIHLSYFGRTISCYGYTNGNLFPIKNHPKGGIKINISERDPFTSLRDPEKLLVVSYASDGNSLPGNEFWRGWIDNSSNSATAASSQVAENHNPLINAMVCADNLMVATTTGLSPVHEYISGL